MLDLVFVRLIAAGIERLCVAHQSDQRNAAHAADPEQLIRELTAIAPETVGELIGRCVKDIWHSCQAVGLPAELAEPHLAALPAIIRKAPFHFKDYELFLAPDGQAADDAVSELSNRAIVAAADDGFASAIDETVLSYLLEAFLQSLHASRQLLQAIQPHATRILEHTTAPNHSRPPNQGDHSKAAVTLAKIERADALGISVPLLEAITVALINVTRKAELRNVDLRAAAAKAIEIDAGLQQLPVRAPKFRDILQQVKTTFRAGKLSECDRQLAIIEDEIVKLSIAGSLRDPELANLAIELRALRAGMHNLTGAFIKAARHFGFAQRYIPRADTESRWHFAQREADNYELAAYFQPTTQNSLENAARACTSALAAVENGPDTPLLKAGAQSGLAHALILIGERDQDAARFELAAQLLADAQSSYSSAMDTFDKLPETVLETSDLHATVLRNLQQTTIHRANALTRLGELHANGDLIEQAAVLLQSLLSGDHPVVATEAHEVRTRLALALISFGRLAGQPEFSSTALTTIRNELSAIELAAKPYDSAPFAASILAARCHQALADALDLAGNDPTATEHRGIANKYWQSIGFPLRTRKVPPSRNNAGSSSNPGDQLADREADAA